MQQFISEIGEVDFKQIKLNALKKMAYSSADSWDEQTIELLKTIISAAENQDEDYLSSVDLGVLE